LIKDFYKLLSKHNIRLVWSQLDIPFRHLLLLLMNWLQISFTCVLSKIEVLTKKTLTGYRKTASKSWQSGQSKSIN